jgi:predicted CoA-binding protein
MNIAAMAQRETDAEKALAAASAILVVDWPSRDVPDTLARSGLAVIADEGPGNYRRYDLHGGAVQVRTLAHAPERVDIVYAHRPLDELSEIVLTAKQLAATTVWIQSGRDSGGRKEPTGCWLAPDDSRRARGIVEGAGLRYVDAPYIADVARSTRSVGTERVEPHSTPAADLQPVVRPLSDQAAGS